MNEAICAQRLREGNDYLIITHRNPDGDTVGSAAALCRGLRKLGKRAFVLSGASFQPRQRELLAGLLTEECEGFTVVYTDVAAPDMVMAEAKNLPADVVIDHHLNNRVPCEDKLVVPEAAATGEIIFRLLSAWGVSLDADIAKALYIAVSTDTGCFAFDNTTPETHRIAAELLRFDFGAGGVNRTYFQEKTFAALRLQAELICGMRLFAEGRIAAVYVPMSLRRDLGITEEDLEDVSSLARSVAGVDAGVTLRELSDESGWKISLRTSTAVNAAEICALFGGGGHARAAGCTLSGTAEKVTEQIVAAIEKTLKAR